MAGFFGQIGRAIDSAHVPSVATSQGGPLPRSVQSILCESWCSVVAVVRPGERVAMARDERRGRVLAIIGAPIWAEPFGTEHPDAAALLARMGDGDRWPAALLDGSFASVLIDTVNRSVCLASDHLASRSQFWSMHGSTLSFGPSSRSVAALRAVRPTLSPQGAAGYLAVGYPLGAHTMVDGVFRLRPAQELTFASGQAAPTLTRWWDFQFGNVRPMRLKNAADQLHEEVLRAHRTVLQDGPKPIHIALTGGYDSRLMVSALTELGLLPMPSFTWAAHANVAESDPDIASRLARLAGISHQVLRFDAKDFLSHLDDWCLESGLMSDNLGHFAGGADFLKVHGISGAVLVGDQMFGPGGTFASRDTAIAGGLGLPWPGLGPHLDGLLTGDGRHTIQDMLREQVDELLSTCNSDNPKDLNHYLSFHAGVFGWLMAPGFYKEPMVEARRPLLTRRLLDIVATWPGTLRVDKQVEVEVLRAFYPEACRIPKAHASALQDWKVALNQHPALAGRVGELLRGPAMREGPLRGIIDFERSSTRLDAILRESDSTSAKRGRRMEWAFQIRRRMSTMPSAASLIRAAEHAWRGVFPTPQRQSEVRMLFRIALLERFAELMDAGK